LLGPHAEFYTVPIGAWKRGVLGDGEATVALAAIPDVPAKAVGRSNRTAAPAWHNSQLAAANCIRRVARRGVGAHVVSFRQIRFQCDNAEAYDGGYRALKNMRRIHINLPIFVCFSFFRPRSRSISGRLRLRPIGSLRITQCEQGPH